MKRFVLGGLALALALVLLGIGAAPASAKPGTTTCKQAAAANKLSDYRRLGDAATSIASRDDVPRNIFNKFVFAVSDNAGSQQVHRGFNAILKDCGKQYAKALVKVGPVVRETTASRATCDEVARANALTDATQLGSALATLVIQHYHEFGTTNIAAEFPSTAFLTNPADVAKVHSGFNGWLRKCASTYPAGGYDKAVNVAAAIAPATTAAPPPPPTTAYVPPQVTYEVTGDGQADLTLQNASGGTDQYTVDLPWSQTFPRPAGGFVYVSAQQTGSGNVACKITYGTRVVQQASSNGDYVIASCSGSV